MVGAGVYSALLVAFGTTIASLMFGREIVIEERWLLLGAISTTCLVTAQGFFVALRAREQSHRVLLVHVVVLLIMVVLLPLVVVSGITGLLFSQMIAWGLAVVVAGLLVARRRFTAREGPEGRVDAAAPL